MTIYTTAARVARFDVCEGGTERTAAALAREGKTMDTVVTLQNILHSLGLTDALFSFCDVEPGSEVERDRVLGRYIVVLGALLCPGVQVAVHEDRAVYRAVQDARMLIDKRGAGIEREAFAKRVLVTLLRAKREQDAPHLRYWLQGIAELLGPKPNYLAATHATVACIEGYRALGMEARAVEHLTKRLESLLNEG